MQAGQAPTIRSGVDLVAVDVQVVDGQGEPVANLTPADFEVTIDGRRRPVVSAELVKYSGSSGPSPESGASAAVPAAGGVARPRRMFIIAVDEHSIRVGAARAATEAARRFVDRLGPDDLVGLHAYPTAVAHTDLTNDHAAVRSAFEKVTGQFERPITRYNLSPSEVIDIASRDSTTLASVIARECRGDLFCRKELPLEAMSLAAMFEMKIAQSLGGLRGLISGLAAIPGRKTLVLVSGGLLASDRADGRLSARSEMTAIGREAAASNTTVYALHMDTSFLDAFAADGKVTQTLFRDSSMFATGLEMVAGAAGGDVLRVQAGTPDSAFARILRETSAHYLLGVEVADPDRDGRAHAIRVQVKRRGVTVRSRSSVIVPRPSIAPDRPRIPAATESPGKPPAAEAKTSASDLSLDGVLRRAGDYLARYERELAAIVAEERYQQRALREGYSEPPATRQLRSDMLVIADSALGWIGFRDVFEVDGRAVRSRDERLATLFLKPSADRMEQAQRIVAESSRFNLNTGTLVVQRSINIPIMALRFLAAANQPRSRFKSSGLKNVDGTRVMLVEFEERSLPRIIRSSDDAAARGKFWIEPISGRVIRTELALETRGGKTTVRSLTRVAFALEPKLGLWLPASMDEEYFTGLVTLTGRASYSNFRRFTVETRTDVKGP
jgi:VWFA-related protein